MKRFVQRFCASNLVVVIEAKVEVENVDVPIKFVIPEMFRFVPPMFPVEVKFEIVELPRVVEPVINKLFPLIAFPLKFPVVVKFEIVVDASVEEEVVIKFSVFVVVAFVVEAKRFCE